MKSAKSERVDLLQGTLDLLVLRTLLLGPLHGHGIGKAIQRNSDELLRIDHGSLYPALHRMVRKGWLTSGWQGARTGRPMKFYRLTPLGRRQLAAEQSNWEQVCRAIGLVLKSAKG
jgi:PadR family transcriptional regulator, regulatory protein PadR